MDTLTKKEIRMLKNRQAADRSRKRKAEHIASLESSISSLEARIKSYQEIISYHYPNFSSNNLFLNNSNNSVPDSLSNDIDSLLSSEIFPSNNNSSFYNFEPAVFA